MSRLKLKKIEEKLEQGKDFELTNEEYKRLTEADIPKTKYYVEKTSPVALLAKKYGFQIEVIPLHIKFSRTAEKK